ncbi:LacI family DNA-binding transcriptional regulator [Cellulomonas shaoxiangyii]|uniref:LacI family DNA-binding transcriptional regulator n=1 Tax=Cellulomonas shaoxiangyii TaxID=2566013 RepID=UPI001FB59053|nr:LacI family DNA-binding transcriptional regulator [Cellulomonas shaoxiangyii]
MTSRDVARRAGVSQSTVSYVLNDTPGQTISAATRARVQEAAAALAYTPSAAARALRAGRTDTVLVVLADMPVSPAAVAIMGVLGATLRPYGYADVYQRRDGRDLSQMIASLTPVAVVDLGAFTFAEVTAEAARGVPVVGVSLDGVDGHLVRVPQRTIGRLQAEHLVARGHTRLGYAAAADPRATALARGRAAGVHEVCAERGLPEPVTVDVPLYPDAAERAVRRLRERPDPVTGVCAYDDEVALAVLAGLRAAGLSAPRDLAVVGVDDAPLARLAAPALTTVDVQTADVGASLARHVLNRVQPSLGLPEPDDEPSIHLVVRAST